VTKTQSAGPISCLEHRAARVLHCAIVTRADVLMFPLLLQSIISNQMKLRRLRGVLVACMGRANENCELLIHVDFVLSLTVYSQMLWFVFPYSLLLIGQ